MYMYLIIWSHIYIFIWVHVYMYIYIHIQVYLCICHMIYAFFDAIPRSQKQLQRCVQVGGEAQFFYSRTCWGSRSLENSGNVELGIVSHWSQISLISIRFLSILCEYDMMLYSLLLYRISKDEYCYPTFYISVCPYPEKSWMHWDSAPTGTGSNFMTPSIEMVIDTSTIKLGVRMGVQWFITSQLYAILSNYGSSSIYRRDNQVTFKPGSLNSRMILQVILSPMWIHRNHGGRRG